MFKIKTKLNIKLPHTKTYRKNVKKLEKSLKRVEKKLNFTKIQGTRRGNVHNLGKFKNNYKKLLNFSKKINNIKDKDIKDIKEHKIDKVLIANRGEIACRIINSCRKLGIKSVAVYSDSDINSPHVKLADESVHIGPSPSLESYLVVDKIIDACKKTGANGVHPGYGFLSEQTQFVKALEDNNITFIGPNSEAIKAMGDKITSKEIAKKSNVNIVPGYLGIINSDEEAIKIADSIGYPVMIKASAGGGGKGMRVAWNDSEVIEGYRLSKIEAASSFNDDRVFIEKYIQKPRHIEIQVLGDNYGNVVYLNERECSIQRRNQKVIEEAPSTFIDPSFREEMGKQAVELAKAVNYNSAGTVEFLVDANKGFYFLEMNTRLQVEHPITELITGVDLVEQMIHVAKGKKLEIEQKDVQLNGWAIESRVYAEDPVNEFLPSTGTLSTYREPHGEGIRVDSGVVEGSEISIHYDPMISKVVSYGKTRVDAIKTMKRALDTYFVSGVRNNISFLRTLLKHKRFVSGNIDTNFIPEEFPQGFDGVELTNKQKHHVLYSLLCIHVAKRIQEGTIDGKLDSSEEFVLEDDMVLYLGKERFTANVSDIIAYDEGELEVTATIKDSGKVLGGQTATCKTKYYPGDLICEVQVGKDDAQTCQVYKSSTEGYQINKMGQMFETIVRTPQEDDLFQYMPAPLVLDTSKMVIAPMPSSVFEVSVKVGQKISAGQEIMVLEAMKMQNSVKSPSTGIVKYINCQQGDTVPAGEILIELE